MAPSNNIVSNQVLCTPFLAPLWRRLFAVSVHGSVSTPSKTPKHLLSSLLAALARRLLSSPSPRQQPSNRWQSTRAAGDAGDAGGGALCRFCRDDQLLVGRGDDRRHRLKWSDLRPWRRDRRCDVGVVQLDHEHRSGDSVGLDHANIRSLGFSHPRLLG
ncbi:unnamed protein product [Ectocarpus sp. 12 AP-2014]